MSLVCDAVIIGVARASRAGEEERAESKKGNKYGWTISHVIFSDQLFVYSDRKERVIQIICTVIPD